MYFTSCDPGQEIHLKNNRSNKIEIRFIENGNSHHSIKNQGVQNRVISDTSVFFVEKEKTDTIRFGIGTWEVHNRLDTFIYYLDRVELIENDNIEIYRGEFLSQLLRKSMTGKLNHILELDFNEWGRCTLPLSRNHFKVEILIV